uniref:Alcohol dehydrogenase notN n=1 Tax=Aspergillus sp. (strain MF297-2) TaxID=877550 RepID=NOTN_ASPSM|nr:RecName: Full=Alcohol dehydrogenase notN; AltName: Full=Notoamide biosynthesis cluster protein N [Aspergillus sp. MF297-2]ADM34147.1 dehydrogenase [Aspergillus sp. MF297-2]
MSLPQTYKRAVFKELGHPLTVEDAPLKLPGPNELLIKVEACGVCYSDMYSQYNGLGGGFPIVPGHEIIGKVAVVGSEVRDWNVGQRIGAGWHGGHDGTCKACKQGYFQMCDSTAVNGATKEGGYAEYTLIRSESAVHIPANVDAASYAPILCAGLTVFNSIRNVNIRAGETVAVQGLGGLGHLAIQYAKRMGYRVVAISRGPEKEAAARELGADEYIDSNEGDSGEQLAALGGAALAVTTASTGEAITPLLKGLGILGKLLVLSFPSNLTLEPTDLLKYGLSVHFWPSGHPSDAEDAVRFAENTNIASVVEKFPLEQAQQAFESMLSGKVRFRAVITMD